MAKKPETEAKNKGGRPPSIVEDDATLAKIRLLGAGQHSRPEAASLLGISKSCFNEFLASHEKALEAWEDGVANGKASLRRMQFVNAKNGNVTMQIWLGKQYLEQRDKHETTGADGGAIKTEATVTLDAESIKQLRDILE